MTVTDKPMWHELTDEQRAEVKSRKAYTFRDLMRDYAQPDWCTYPEALCGEMGCWSLFYTPRVIGNDYCLKCECHRDHECKPGCGCPGDPNLEEEDHARTDV